MTCPNCSNSPYRQALHNSAGKTYNFFLDLCEGGFFKKNKKILIFLAALVACPAIATAMVMQFTVRNPDFCYVIYSDSAYRVYGSVPYQIDPMIAVFSYDYRDHQSVPGQAALDYAESHCFIIPEKR